VRVSQTGGKFNPAKAAAQQLQAVYFSEPMSVKGARKYMWHKDLALNVLPAGRAEVDPTCENLNPLTRGALARVSSAGKLSRSDANVVSR